jgi:hypothetical protein
MSAIDMALPNDTQLLSFLKIIYFLKINHGNAWRNVLISSKTKILCQDEMVET